MKHRTTLTEKISAIESGRVPKRVKANVSIVVLIVVLATIYFAVFQHDDVASEHPKNSLQDDAVEIAANNGESATKRTRELQPESESVSDGPEEVIRSLYDADRDFRDAALAAVEAEMSQRLSSHPDGWLRWQPVWIDSLRVTNGSYLDEELVAKEFDISPFPGETYRALRTLFRPREATASATWEGVLDNGQSGVIQMTLMAMENGETVVRIRMRTLTGQYTILPTDVHGAYVAAELNGEFWRTQIAQ